MARSLGARAFTHGGNVVFRAGEFQPNTSAGRHLLAHELTHSIQQGASSRLGASALEARLAAGTARAPMIQCTCETTTPPSDMVCQDAISSVGTGTPILFGINSSGFTAADQATLSAIAAGWHSGGGVTTVRIDGFASCDGSAALNWRLSCDRAMAVAAELMAPSDGSPGIPAAHIEVLANGETDQFSSSSLPANRRAVVTTGGAPPVGPPCSLTISGPDEVDHYCAAYVPSDAAACGVFPAPNITLTVAGAAPGASLRWSIVTGATEASIVGSSTGASVDISGDNQSTAQGDVTVQATDGACSTTHAITVREPDEMTAVEAPSSGPTFIADIITYTVRDQFGNAMGAGICVDETVTVCANSIPGATFSFGDAPTDASGEVTDTLRATFPGGVPADLCVKLDQVLTAGGCGPLLHNTILFQSTGITLTLNDSCAPGDPCP